MKRRRNKLVLWEWSPSGKHEQSPQRSGTRSVARDALTAAVLLGVLIFLISLVPSTTSGYRKPRLTSDVCQMGGVAPRSPQCFALTIVGWFGIVVTLGVVLKIIRLGLRAVGLGEKRHD